ncbi:MAG: redoxin domain-containing protein, partial [Spirochaetaceae bacterium]|nr:redoxin domain-containing protein [Spirochaetaceae bacterium]
MLKEGDKIPAFTLKNSEDESISISDFPGKTIVIYFYPKDNTPGC